MNATVGRFTPWPMKAIATGIMRTRVRLRAAYTSTCQVMCGRASVSASAPNPIQVTAARNPPVSSVSRVMFEPLAPREAPEGDTSDESCDERAATERYGECVGQERRDQRQYLPPIVTDPSTPIRHTEQKPTDDAGTDAGGESPADLHNHVAENRRGDAGVKVGIGHVERDKEERHGESIVEAALHVERLAHAWGHRRVGDDFLAERCVGRGQHRGEEDDGCEGHAREDECADTHSSQHREW